MMKIIVIRSTFIRGKAVVASPDSVEVEDTIAKQLITLGKAIAVPAEPPAVPAEPPANKPNGRGKS
jgi:hypothetical protein